MIMNKRAIQRFFLWLITLWLDCNSNFYGACHDLGKQSHGEVVLPLTNFSDRA